MQIIKEIPALETFSVRQPVLRPGKPIETCHFEGDNLESTKHFGLFSNEKLAGIASLFICATPFLKEEPQFQLRGMAVLPEFQKKGLGEALVKHAENDALERGGKIIWFNAREIAVTFYKKLGYEIVGEPFDIADIGKHYVMYKNLNAL
ncbi:GNAT family N-acetyltransferase [Flavobacterium microcysteis]|uniref:GNAT family N-acetyltransferase n=1 Tax=Flavobacterium microcysteis TaxID=2596891 RepID=A0A501Q019_9FLAO|nr:GNAT family N-acetyltransferase [Flavobacterium microcysteis]TPD65607.1 GNAT family N-acetyltransferase [Flavobacterium microcysteis]